MVQLFPLEKEDEIERVRGHDPPPRRVHQERAGLEKSSPLGGDAAKFVKVYPND